MYDPRLSGISINMPELHIFTTAPQFHLAEFTFT
jgi:hypothetical protein